MASVIMDRIRDALKRAGLDERKISTFLSWAEANGLFGVVINDRTPVAELVEMARSPMVQALGTAQVQMSTPIAWGDSGGLNRQAESGTCGCTWERLCSGHAAIRNRQVG